MTWRALSIGPYQYRSSPALTKNLSWYTVLPKKYTSNASTAIRNPHLTPGAYTRSLLSSSCAVLFT